LSLPWTWSGNTKNGCHNLNLNTTFYTNISTKIALISLFLRHR